MSSHTRYVVKIGGHYYGGRSAFATMHDLTNMPMQTAADLVKGVAWLRSRGNTAEMWALRERRKLKTKYSRYRQICAAFGLRRRKLSPHQAQIQAQQAMAESVFQMPVMPAPSPRIRNGGTNTSQGLPTSGNGGVLQFAYGTPQPSVWGSLNDEPEGL